MNKWIKILVIVRNVLYNYYINYILLILCVKFIYPYINIENYSLAANLIKTVVMIAVCMVITCIVRRIPLLKKMVM